MTTLSGRCMCGAIRFRFESAETAADACHCSQCRRWSGHYWSSVNGPLAGFAIIQGDEELTWYKSSDFARRGFCRSCGSSLFWHAFGDEKHKEKISVATGSLEAPSEVKLTKHIFVADKGDYYDITDALPQKEQY